MTRTAACPSGALVLRPVAGYRGRLHPDLRRQAAGQDRRPSRARRVPRLPPRRRHPRHPGPGPAIPAPAGPDHHRGRAAPPRHRVPVRHEALDTTTPGGWSSTSSQPWPSSSGGSSWRGVALPGAATRQHRQAAALLAWLAEHRTPRSAQISTASAGCAVRPKTASSRNFGCPVIRLVWRQAEALPDLLLDDLRRGPRVHGVDVLLAPEDRQDGVGLVVIVPGGSFLACVLAGCRGEAWLKKGLLSSK